MNQNLEQILHENGIDEETIPHILRLADYSSNTLTVPSKVAEEIMNPTKKIRNSDLKPIFMGKKDITDHDYIVARELCLFFLTNLTNTYYLSKNSNDIFVKAGYKKLNAARLADAMPMWGKKPYAKIRQVLIGAGFIEKSDRPYIKGEASWEFRLTDRYFKKGNFNYEIQTEEVMELQGKFFNDMMMNALSTYLGKNSMKLRALTYFPTVEEMEAHLKEVAASGYTNKENKKLINLNNKKRDDKDYIYVEDYLQQYQDIQRQMPIPAVKKTWFDRAHRVADFYNMMPRAVRPALKVQGKDMVEIDFNSLHPNIIQFLYNPNESRPITHDIVVEELYGIKKGHADFKAKRKKVKTAHLSYFNMRWEDMLHSEVHPYYMEHYHEMMGKIEVEKREPHFKPKTKKQERENKNAHKVTSKNLFEAETILMEKIMKRCWDKGLTVAYVYDAIYTHQEHAETVKTIMNEVADEMNILTTAELG